MEYRYYLSLFDYPYRPIGEYFYIEFAIKVLCKQLFESVVELHIVGGFCQL